jgi:hypothetical protein
MTMSGAEKTLGSVPKPLDEDLLNVYRMLPTSDIERLLDHIEWMEQELDRVQLLQRRTEKELNRVATMLNEVEETSDKSV